MSADTVIVPTALPVGYVLNGTYAIVSVLGQGGFAITYLATDLTTQRQVVLKENYPAQLVYREPGQYRIAPCGAEAEFSYKAVLQSFIDEARVLTHLRHPHIVQVLTAFQTLGTAYYVMDYVGGRPLHKAAPSSEKITEEWLLSVMKSLLCALQYLHTLPQPLLHRDIKPNNILLLPDGSPVLIDFGLAREAAAGPTSMLAAYTPGYSPLEQNSRAKRGPWSDLYALGATCYYLLTGENPPDCHERTDDDPYRPLGQRPELRRRFSPAVLAGIDRALRMPRHERWQTAQDWLDSLFGKQAAAEVVSGSKSRPRRGKAVFAAALLLLAAAGTVSYYQGFVSEPDKRTVNEMNMSRIMSIMIQDVRLENTPIEDVLDFLRGEARKYGLTLNFVYNDSAVPPGTPQPIVSNLALQAVSIKEFLHYVCLKANCQYRVEDGAIVITPVVSGNQPQPQPVEPAPLPEEESDAPEDRESLIREVDQLFAAEQYEGLVERLTPLAEQGYAPAQGRLGACYFHGYGVSQDYEQAVSWYRKAAEQGLAAAQCYLGQCYYGGHGVAQNNAQAVSWYREAAEQGLAVAQCLLGVCYADGQGVAQDYEQAVSWFRKAAEQGQAEAQYNLGQCYYGGHGVAQDYAQTVQWYRKAAEQGHAAAQCNLGWCYLEGRGVLQDYAQAVSWFRKAAEQGLDEAQYNLGLCYQNGQGVPQDYAQAVQWYRKAAEQGHAEAQEALRSLGQ
ncbi:MAG: SEL1-like repeat protein [Akkermansia sp.]|nr:SEL1-like repeat protein [Akkermansia sp.]